MDGEILDAWTPQEQAALARLLTRLNADVDTWGRAHAGRSRYAVTFGVISTYARPTHGSRLRTLDDLTPTRPASSPREGGPA